MLIYSKHVGLPFEFFFQEQGSIFSVSTTCFYSWNSRFCDSGGDRIGHVSSLLATLLHLEASIYEPRLTIMSECTEDSPNSSESFCPNVDRKKTTGTVRVIETLDLKLTKIWGNLQRYGRST